MGGSRGRWWLRCKGLGDERHIVLCVKEDEDLRSIWIIRLANFV